MNEQVVLLTGSTGGLGSEIAKQLSTSGYKIALHYHQHATVANDLLHTLNKSSHAIFSADLIDAPATEKMVNDVAKHFGRIDIVINNAGVSYSGMSWKQPVEDWNNVFAMNVGAAFLVSKYAVPHLRKQKSGRIINISSVVANRPLIGTSAYSASKAAVEGFTRAQSIELAHFGITVNCIAPGYFEAGMIREIDEVTRQQLLKEIPLRRLGKPAELSDCLLYLCSDKASYITGQIIHVNGGLYL